MDAHSHEDVVVASERARRENVQAHFLFFIFSNIV